MFPQPVLIIGTYDENGVPNAMNAAWGITTDFKESVITDGAIDPKKLRPITFDPANNAYIGLGEKVGNAFKDGAALK